MEKEKKEKIKYLVSKTGLNERKCTSYLERFNWSLEKTLDYSIIKSAIKNKEKNSTDEEIEEKKKRKKKKETKSKDKKSEKKRVHNGIEYYVEIIGNSEYFNGKEIKMDNSGFYHPFPTMKEIVKWTKENIKRRN